MTLDKTDRAILMAIQAAWALILWPIAIAFWRANREKVTGYGG